MKESIGNKNEIFTLVFDNNWNTSKDLFKKEYKIISEIKETEDGFEYEIEEV